MNKQPTERENTLSVGWEGAEGDLGVGTAEVVFGGSRDLRRCAASEKSGEEDELHWALRGSEKI